jgi:putative resolvase
LPASARPAGNHRRFAPTDADAQPLRRTFAYARVSGHVQKAHLERQEDWLCAYAVEQGRGNIDVIADLGSRMNRRDEGVDGIRSSSLTAR